MAAHNRTLAPFAPRSISTFARKRFVEERQSTFGSMAAVRSEFTRRFLTLVAAAAVLFPSIPVPSAFAAVPSAGGDTTVVNPTGEGAVSITEDAVQPESANIRLVVGTLVDSDGGTPGKIRILSVTGGTLWQSNGSSITLGSAGTKLTLSSGRIDLRFRPDAGRDEDATFRYAVVDVQDESLNSAASIATVPITAVNDSPVLQTLSGETGIGLAATYYISSWDLTGSTYQRIDSTVNFSNNFAVPGFNDENFSVRWSGQVKSPVTGNVVFSTQSDDGVRLWIDGDLIIDNWTLHGTTTDTASAVSLTAGEKYDIRMEFYERGGGEVAILQWAYTGQSTQVVPQAYLFPATTRPALSYVNGAASAIIDDAITVADVDSTAVASGSVVISSNYVSSEDSLLFTDQNGITGTLSGNTLLLTGSASLANYQAALRTVRYANGASSPTTSTRTVTFTVTDAEGGTSNSTYRTITFTATNNPPVITEGASVSVTMDQNSNPTAFSLTLNATDADYHSIEWSISSAASHGTASVSGNGDSKAISYEPDDDYNGSDSFVVQADDGNGGTDTITVNVTITERNPPVLSSVSATPSGTGSVTFAWNTNEDASTKISYGLDSSYGTTTSETDTSPRVSSHSRSVSGLLSCTTYHYAVTSLDAAENSATSSDKTFTTGGCPGDAEVTSSTGTTVIHNANGSTGSVLLSAASFRLDVPTGYLASNPTCPAGASFQLKGLETSPVKEELGAPSGKDTIVRALELSAYCPDATRVTSFDEGLTLTFSYSDDDVDGLVESSLGAYRFGSGSTAWEALTCTQDASANTLTCQTTHFSSFGLFGTPTPSSSTSAARAAGNGGCRGTGCKTRSPSARVASAESPAHPVAACSAATLSSDGGRLDVTMGGTNVRFGDVPVDAWFACHVRDVVTGGIFDGYRSARGEPLGLYGPADSITMGQLAKVALRLAEAEVPSASPGEDWHAPFVRTAKALGLSAFQGRFDPDSPAPRGTVVTTVLEAVGIPAKRGPLPYPDVPTESPDAPAIATATALGIVSGDDGTGTFRPNEPVNRAEVAKIVLKAIEASR